MSHRTPEPVDPESIRLHVLRLAGFIQAMDRDGRLLEAAPRLLKWMGDLRSQLFEYEVRHTRRLLPRAASAERAEGAGGAQAASAETDERTALERESQRIVNESLERLRRLEDEWRRGGGSEDDV